MSLRTLLDRFRRPAPAEADTAPAVSRARPVGSVTVNVRPDTAALRPPPLPRRPDPTPCTRGRLHVEVAISHTRAALADLDRWADTDDPAEARVRHVAACHQLEAARHTLARAHRALLHHTTAQEDAPW